MTIPVIDHFDIRVFARRAKLIEIEEYAAAVIVQCSNDMQQNPVQHIGLLIWLKIYTNLGLVARGAGKGRVDYVDTTRIDDAQTLPLTLA